eukprot:355170_1
MSALSLDLDLTSSSTDSVITATPCNTPISILSPSTPTIIPKIQKTNANTIPCQYSARNTIKNAGYVIREKIGEAMQGSVYKVSRDQRLYVIKVANKSLHKDSVAILRGKITAVSEDIIQERTILQYLCAQQPHPLLAQYASFFSDQWNYFLVTHYAGPMSLFDFVDQCHKYIKKGILSIKEWQSFCKNALKQMVSVLDWLHNTMDTCHLDISLENFVIDNVFVTEEGNQIVFCTDFEIRLIDFGLAQVFTESKDFMSTKFVGKKLYMAPEVYSKKAPFDARLADCWSVAVSFFMMVTGLKPFDKPSMSDGIFEKIMSGKLSGLMGEWGLSEYSTPNMLNLMNCLFQVEKYRANIKDVHMHPYLLY